MAQLLKRLGLTVVYIYGVIFQKVLIDCYGFSLQNVSVLNGTRNVIFVVTRIIDLVSCFLMPKCTH